MASSRTRKRPGSRRFDHSVAKPRGPAPSQRPAGRSRTLQLVCFDLAKVRSSSSWRWFVGCILKKSGFAREYHRS
jgi:hypothetical protein